MNMDDELHHALRRQEAPADLSNRVLDRIAAGQNASEPARRAWTAPNAVRRWLAAAALLIVSAGAAGRYYTHQQQAAEAARVQEEIRTALQITSKTLDRVQRTIARPAADKSR